jgi:hypothetical protein
MKPEGFEKRSKLDPDAVKTRAKERKRIRALIAAAWADAVYPGDDRLVPRTQYDDDEQEAEAAFQGKTWLDVVRTARDGSLRSYQRALNGSHLFFVTPEAFGYFLAAFLWVAVVVRPRTQLASEIGSMVFLMGPPDQIAHSAYRSQLQGVLSHAQRAAVLATLQYLNEHLPGAFRGRDNRLKTLAHWQGWVERS